MRWKYWPVIQYLIMMGIIIGGINLFAPHQLVEILALRIMSGVSVVIALLMTFLVWKGRKK